MPENFCKMEWLEVHWSFEFYVAFARGLSKGILSLTFSEIGEHIKNMPIIILDVWWNKNDGSQSSTPFLSGAEEAAEKAEGCLAWLSCLTQMSSFTNEKDVRSFFIQGEEASTNHHLSCRHNVILSN